MSESTAPSHKRKFKETSSSQQQIEKFTKENGINDVPPRLPLEIWTIIINYAVVSIKSHKDIKSISSVCKDFYNDIRLGRLWRSRFPNWKEYSIPLGDLKTMVNPRNRLMGCIHLSHAESKDIVSTLIVLADIIPMVRLRLMTRNENIFFQICGSSLCMINAVMFEMKVKRSLLFQEVNLDFNISDIRNFINTCKARRLKFFDNYIESEISFSQNKINETLPAIINDDYIVTLESECMALPLPKVVLDVGDLEALQYILSRCTSLKIKQTETLVRLSSAYMETELTSSFPLDVPANCVVPAQCLDSRIYTPKYLLEIVKAAKKISHKKAVSFQLYQEGLLAFHIEMPKSILYYALTKRLVL